MSGKQRMRVQVPVGGGGVFEVCRKLMNFVRVFDFASWIGFVVLSLRGKQ